MCMWRRFVAGNVFTKITAIITDDITLYGVHYRRFTSYRQLTSLIIITRTRMLLPSAGEFTPGNSYQVPGTSLASKKLAKRSEGRIS